jgi:thioredoxin reductase (NADPH)
MTYHGDEAFPALSDEQWARLQAYGSAQEVESGALLFGVGAAGGQAAASSRIENYLGFTSGISGAELTGRAAVQAQKFGTRIASPSQAARLDTTHERLTALKHEGGTLDTYLANYGLFHLEADLRWIDMTAARLDALAREVRK